MPPACPSSPNQAAGFPPTGNPRSARVIMVRIFLPLAALSICSLVFAMILGLTIDDPKVLAAQAGVQYHFLAALAALVFATLVHAIVLTYFMGTGRWIEE